MDCAKCKHKGKDTCKVLELERKIGVKIVPEGCTEGEEPDLE